MTLNSEGLLAKKTPHIEVVAAVIERDGKFLIAQRPADKHKGGCWEFPGGKIERGESSRQALVRELKEEVGITIGSARPFIKLTHQYPEKKITLDVWLVGTFEGEPLGLEGQPIEWINVNQIQNYVFPEADEAILNAIRLPKFYAITKNPSDVGGVGPFVTQFHGLVEREDVRLVQLRAKGMNKDVLIRLVEQCQAFCSQFGAELILNEHYDLVKKYNLAGVHLTTKQLRQLSARPLPRSQWVFASCHSYADVETANELGVDAITLSPVKSTPSHPGLTTLGWDNFTTIAEASNVPVFALGGMTKDDAPIAWRNGAQGVAGISEFWTAS